MTTSSDKPENVDMSPEAIEKRLRDVAQLYKLGMEIERAKYLGKVSEIRNDETNNCDES